jgi:hypothetical protein
LAERREFLGLDEAVLRALEVGQRCFGGVERRPGPLFAELHIRDVKISEHATAIR